jgi:hypothetical protein
MMRLISLIARKKLAHMNAIVTRGMLREHQAIRYRDTRGESKGPKCSSKSQRQGQEQRQGCLFLINGAPLKMSVEGKSVRVSLVLLTNASRMDELQNL